MMRRLSMVAALFLTGAMIGMADETEGLAAQGLAVLKGLLKTGQSNNAAPAAKGKQNQSLELLNDLLGDGQNAAQPKAVAPAQPEAEKVQPPKPVNVAQRALQVCNSEEELSKAIAKAIEPYKFSYEIREEFADGEQTAAIGGSDSQYYFYFLGRIDEIETIPAEDLDVAVKYYILDAMLPPAPPRITYYQRGSKMLALSKNAKGDHTIAWYMNNEKKMEFTMSHDNRFTEEQLSSDNLDSLDRMSFHMFDLNHIENLAVFLLKGKSKSFLFLGRVPVEKNFIRGNRFPVSP